MKIGKLDHDELRRLVISRLPAVGQQVTSGPAIGVDCSTVRFGDGQVVLSTDPITGAAADIGRLAVMVATNDIAACGIRPSALLLTIIAPPDATADDIRTVIDQASAAAARLNVSIIGGHTEVSDAVTRFVISATAMGFTYGNKVTQASGGKAGDTLVMTKTAGLEGTAILAADQEKRLARQMTSEDLQAARALMARISVIEEGSCGGDLGVHAMHDATEGGILGACWELAEASNLGLVIDKSMIPIHPLTRRICDLLNIDPLRLVASGSLIIATPAPDTLIAALESKGIEACAIGILTETTGRKLVCGDETLDLQPPGPDELYKIT